MKDIIRASVILSFATLVSLIVTIIKRKLFAVYLGPSGLGVYAQIFNYFNVATVIATFGLSQAITTYVATDKDIATGKSINDIMESATSILLFLSFLIVFFSIAFSKALCGVILNDSSVYYLLIIGVIAIPFQALGQAYLSFLQGIKMTKKISMANICISILGLVGTVPLLIYRKTFGAVMSIPFLAILTLLIFVYFCKDTLRLKPIHELILFHKTFKTFQSIKLFNFGLLRFVQTALSWLTFFIMRIIIIKKLGVASNGIYEVFYTFSMLYLPFISSILWSYSYPEYCQAQDAGTLSESVNKFLKLSIVMVLPIMIFLILGRTVLIEKVVFTAQFHSSVGILPLRLIADFLTIILWAFNVVLLAKDRLKTAVVFEIIKDIIFLGLILLSVSMYKLSAILIADIVSALVLLSLSYFYIKKYFSFRLFKQNKYLMLTSLLIICVVSVFPLNDFKFILLAVLICILWLMRYISFMDIKDALKSLRLADTAV